MFKVVLSPLTNRIYCGKSGRGKPNTEQSRAEQSRLALTEQYAIHNKERSQTVSRQDMTAESQTDSKSETWLQKICIDTSMSGLEDGAIRTYRDTAPSITAREYKELRMILE